MEKKVKTNSNFAFHSTYLSPVGPPSCSLHRRLVDLPPVGVIDKLPIGPVADDVDVGGVAAVGGAEVDVGGPGEAHLHGKVHVERPIAGC